MLDRTKALVVFLIEYIAPILDDRNHDTENHILPDVLLVCLGDSHCEFAVDFEPLSEHILDSFFSNYFCVQSLDVCLSIQNLQKRPNVLSFALESLRDINLDGI